MGGDLTLREIAIDPDAVDPEEAELLAEMVQAAVNEGLRAAQELASRNGRHHRRHGRHGPAGNVSSEGPAPLARLVAELAGCRDRPAHRPAARLPHPPRPRRRGRGAGDGDPRGEGEGRPLRALLQPRRGTRLPDLRRPRPRAVDDLRGRGARRRDPDRAHPRVPRPLPRARRGPSPIDGIDAEDLKIAELVRRTDGGRSPRSSWRPTRPRPARRPRCTSPSCSATGSP